MQPISENPVPPSPERRDNGFILALHGLPRTGKDTLARNLAARGYTRAAFADALYKEVAFAFGVPVSRLGSDAWKTTPQADLISRYCLSQKYQAMLQNMGVNTAEPQTSRFHLQMWGTEFRRKLCTPTYWTNEIDFTLNRIRGHIIITDLRFADEADYLARFAWRTNRALRVVELTREGFTRGKSSHVSDNRLPDKFIDHTVLNAEGAPMETMHMVLKYLDTIHPAAGITETVRRVRGTSGENYE